MAIEISKNRGDSLTVGIKIPTGSVSNVEDIWLSIGREVVGKLSSGSLETDPLDDSLFYSKLTATHTNRYIGAFPFIVGIDSTDLGVRRVKQSEALVVNFIDNVNPLNNNSTSSVVDATINVTFGQDNISTDVSLAEIYRGYGVASGGLNGQVLFKSGSENYSTEWDYITTGDVTGLQNSLDSKVIKEVPLFIFVGESNAEGRALNSSATIGELAIRPNIKIWNVDNNVFESLDIGSNNIWNDNIQFQTNKTLCHGWELELANRGLDRIGYNKIFLVKAAQGGSMVADWTSTSGSNFTKFLSRVNGAIASINTLGYSPKIYIFTSLGINDAIAVTNPNTFLSNLQTFHANIRSFLGANTPIIQTQIMLNDVNYTAINNKIIANSDNVKTFDVIVSGLTLIDANQWDYAGMKILANRMLDIAVDVVGLPDNKSGRLVSTITPTWDLTSGNNITLYTVSKTIIRPISATNIWSNAAFRIEANGNSNKFGYGFYDIATNRFTIGQQR